MNPKVWHCTAAYSHQSIICRFITVQQHQECSSFSLSNTKWHIHTCSALCMPIVHSCVLNTYKSFLSSPHPDMCHVCTHTQYIRTYVHIHNPLTGASPADREIWNTQSTYKTVSRVSSSKHPLLQVCRYSN